MKFLTLKDMDLEGKKVLLRVDYNVPLDEEGNVKNDKRIKSTLPTLNYLLEKNAKIILMTHAGRPKGKVVDNMRTKSIAAKLGEIIGKEVKYVAECVGEEVKAVVDSMQPGDILMLENTRFYPAEKSKEESERIEWAKQIAELGDVYVNDAFANCHRDHATMTGIIKFIPGCVGLLVEKEMQMLKEKLDNPEKPMISVIGGVKADKMTAIKNLLKKTDKVLIGGALAFLFLKIAGKNVGASKIDTEGVEDKEAEIKELMADERVVLPVDCIIADKFEADAESKTVDVDSIEDGWMALDIGPKSIEKYVEILKTAKTIVWNGPIGVFEFEKFANGTKQIAETIANSDAISVIGGGDSAAAIEKLGLQDKVTHVSTGGGASLKLIQGKDLVAIKALEENAEKFK